jgi:proteasome lid subunit RPN8/RPN11
MKITLQAHLLRSIKAHGEASYPQEGAGFLLGHGDELQLAITSILPVANKREVDAQHNRYLLSPQDFAKAEMEAARLDLSLIGVFHSHPDHPARPSQFDLDHALPHFLYLITSIDQGRAAVTTGWHLRQDHNAFEEDDLEISQPAQAATPQED